MAVSLADIILIITLLSIGCLVEGSLVTQAATSIAFLSLMSLLVFGISVPVVMSFNTLVPGMVDLISDALDLFLIQI